MSDTTEGDSSSGDEELLDRLFGEFVARCADGETIDPDRELPERPDLRDRVRELVALADSVAVRRVVHHDFPELPGYEILRELGRGGMGTVWLARQPKLDRTVALKTMAAPLRDGSRGRERFDREARAVARLKHPSILQVFEVGEHAGTAYFTMEYVDGRSLAEVIATLKSNGGAVESLRGIDLARAALGDERATLPEAFSRGYIEACCRLVIDVAYALMHAHENGVVHRDVKPSNVLVRHDGRALLFDFGLARVANEATLTMTGDFVGSPLYVSPEQALGHNENLTAQTDVYSLGVTLFELLALDVPFRGKTTHEILDRIRTREAPSVRRFNSAVPVDLAVVIATALEKDLARRYRTALDFAADLERFLQFQPVLARPVGVVTRSFRFAQRNKAWTVAGSLLALLVVGVPLVLLIQAREATRRVERQARKAETINGFLEDMLSSASPDELGHDVRVVDVLAGARRSLSALDDEPEVAIALRRTLAKAYESAGEPHVGVELFDEALQLLDRSAVEDTTIRERLMVQYGWTLAEAGEFRKAEEMLSAAARTLEERYGRDSEHTLAALNNLANVLGDLGRDDEAIALLREVRERRERTLGPKHANTVVTTYNLATALVESGQGEEAQPMLVGLYDNVKDEPAQAGMRVRILKQLGVFNLMLARNPREALRCLEPASIEAAKVFGPDSYFTTIIENDRAMALAMLGQRDQTIATLSRNLDRFATMLGATHDETVVVANNLAYLLYLSGRFADVERVVRERLPPYVAKYGYAQKLAFDLHGELRKVLRDEGRPLELLEEIVRAQDSGAPFTPRQRGRLFEQESSARLLLGDVAGAIVALESALGAFDEANDRSFAIEVAVQLVSTLLTHGRFDAAERVVTGRLAKLEAEGVLDAWTRRSFRTLLARCYVDSGRVAEGGALARELQSEIFAERGPVDGVFFGLSILRTRSFVELDQRDAAAAAAREVVSWIESLVPPQPSFVFEARRELLKAYVLAGHHDSAIRLSVELAAERRCLGGGEPPLDERILFARALVASGEPQRGSAMLRGLLAEADTGFFGTGAEDVRCALAEAMIQAGDVDAAKATLEGLDRVFAAVGATPEAPTRRRIKNLLEQ